METEQTLALAQLEQAHGRVLRIADEHPVARQILPQCLSDSRVYVCAECQRVMAIEPDGEVIVFIRGG